MRYKIQIIAFNFFCVFGRVFVCSIPYRLEFSYKIFSIIKGFRTIVFIFFVISITFRLICPTAFFRCLSNSGIRTGDPHGFNKGRSSKFRVGSRVRQTPEEGRRTYRPKRCGNNNEDEDNSPKTFIDKNHQASSQKFRQKFFSFIRSNALSSL